MAVQGAEPLSRPRMPIRALHDGQHQLDQLLLARRTSPGISFPALLQSSSDPRAKVPESALGMVRLVEVGLKPGRRACPSLATTGVSEVHA
jgi:hypothetical protein